MRFLAHDFFPLVCLIVCTFSSSHCWESYELDLFDLVEEVGVNFYEYLGTSQSSDQNEIKKAYRKLSLQWHPDKNSDPQAEVKFRQIVAVYEVLKDEAKRARYDQILEHGLPDWRQPIFYFRRVRKLSMHELAIALSIIISIGHYFVMWAQYFEKKLTLEDRMDDVKKKLDKQRQKKKKVASEWDEIDAALTEHYNALPKPTMRQTLPCRMTVWLFKSAWELPFYVKNRVFSKPAPVESDNDQDEAEEEAAYIKKRMERANEASRLHLQLNPKNIEMVKSVEPVVGYNMNRPSSNDLKQDESSSKAPNTCNGEWTNKQKNDLIKAIARFPAGYVNRWTKIADAVGRSANDCIEMEKQMKSSITSSSHSTLNSTTWNASKRTVNISEEPTISYNNPTELVATDVDKNTPAAAADTWSQEQQKCLEKALKEVSKDASNRWDLIAEKVPNKTKNECIKRYKEICAALKSKMSSS